MCGEAGTFWHNVQGVSPRPLNHDSDLSGFRQNRPAGIGIVHTKGLAPNPLFLLESAT